MLNYFRAFRQFERFLFRGVPEHPEQIWERETNASATDRYTGRSQLVKRPGSYRIRRGEVIARITYRHDLQQIEISRVDDKTKPTSKMP